MSDIAPIEDVVAAWASAWEACASTHVLALWDNSDKQSWYLPADSVEPHIGGSVVGAIQRRCIGLRAMTYQPRQILPRRLSVDIGAAFFVCDWSRVVDGHDVAIGGSFRATMVMRCLQNTWRIFHYAEAPLAPLLELQAYYERVAAEGFDGMPQRMMPR